MDRFGAVNIRIVLISLIGFTAMALAALLWLIVDGDPKTEPPELLVGLVGTLLGAITGSTVSITAPRRVSPAPETTDLPVAGQWVTGSTNLEQDSTGVLARHSLPEDDEPIGDSDRLRT